MSKDTKANWYCPSCKSEGNTGSFCGTCGKAMPTESSNPVIKILTVIVHGISSVIIFAGAQPILMTGVVGLVYSIVNGDIDDFGVGRIVLYDSFSLIFIAIAVLGMIFGVSNFRKRKIISPEKYTFKEIRTTGMYVIAIILLFVFAAIDTELAGSHSRNLSMVSFSHVVAVMNIVFMIPTVILLVIDAVNKPKK